MHILLVGTFFCKPEIRNLTVGKLLDQSHFSLVPFQRERGRKKKKILFPLVKQQRNIEQCSVLTLQSTPPTPSLFEKLPT